MAKEPKDIVMAAGGFIKPALRGKKEALVNYSILKPIVMNILKLLDQLSDDKFFTAGSSRSEAITNIYTFGKKQQ